MIAERKVEGLLVAGAYIFVIAPEVTPHLRQLADSNQITITNRSFQPSDLDRARLVIAATGDPMTKQAVWNAAKQGEVLVNAVDDPFHCDFTTPAVVRRGPVTIAISTDGASPALAAYLRRRMEASLGDEVGHLAEVLGEFRPYIKHILPKATQRAAFWKSLNLDDLLKLTRSEGKQVVRAQVESFFENWLASIVSANS